MRRVIHATELTSVEPEGEGLRGGVGVVGLGEVVEEAPAGLLVDVHVPGKLPEPHPRLPRQPPHQVRLRVPPHAADQKPREHRRQWRQSPRTSHGGLVVLLWRPESEAKASGQSNGKRKADE